VNPPEGRDRFLDRLLFALSFLTRLPVPSGVHEAGMPSRLGAIPLLATGLILGGLLSLAAWLPTLLPRPLPSFLQAFLLLFLWIALTGALHLDGVADSLEAALVPVSIEEKRRIRKDPRKGVYAIVSLNLLLLGKWIGLLLANPEPTAIFLAPFLSRGFLPLLVKILSRGRPAPSGGLGALLFEPGWPPPFFAALTGVLVAFGTGGGRVGLASLLLLGGLWIAGRQVLNRSDGLSGDLAGLLIEGGETSLLLILSL